MSSIKNYVYAVSFEGFFFSYIDTHFLFEGNVQRKSSVLDFSPEVTALGL